MSQVCDFYIECSEKGCVPVERWTSVPAGIASKTITVENRRGKTITVTGVTVDGAITWAGSDEGAPDYVVSFLETFCGCRVCDQCGCVGRGHWFPTICSPENLCCECA